MALKLTSAYAGVSKGLLSVAKTRGYILNLRTYRASVAAKPRILRVKSMAAGQSEKSRSLNLDNIVNKARELWDNSPQPIKNFPWNSVFNFLHTFSLSVLLNTPHSGRWNRRGLFCTASLLQNSSATSHPLCFYPRRVRSYSPSASTFFEQLVYEPEESPEHEDFSSSIARESFNFDSSFESIELKRFDSLVVDVKELEELPEQWRRSRLAWLCKELHAHKHNTLVRILNAQRKWLRQEDATYIVFHCMRICENESAFWVYKWLMLQHWFQFDFALATRLADYLGKERQYLKCREVYDDILNQGRVPAESTFHILVVAYRSSSGQSVVDEAFNIFSRMIHWEVISLVLACTILCLKL